MAIEREILQDITKYKARLIGPLTARQTVCVVITGAICIPAYMIMKNYFVMDFIFPVLLGLAALPMACGFVAPYDMPLEKFLYYFVQTSIISPPIRRYKKKMPIELYAEQNEMLPVVKVQTPKMSDKEKKKHTEALKNDFPAYTNKGTLIGEAEKNKEKRKG